MTDLVDSAISSLLEVTRERIFRRFSEISKGYFYQSMGGYDLTREYRGGAAIGFKKGDHIGIHVQEINPDLPDFWKDPNGRYAAYAAMKCITALEEGVDTVDTKEEFNFSRAVHAGAVVMFLTEYNAWVAVAFSGYESENDKDIAERILKEFFEEEKQIPSDFGRNLGGCGSGGGGGSDGS